MKELNMEELSNYIDEKLKETNVVVSKEVIDKILDLETEYMIEKKFVKKFKWLL